MRFDTVTKVALISFCTRFHLYIHAYALILQGRGLSLLEISTIESVVTLTLVAAEVPTGLLADRIGRRWSLAASTFLMMCGELLFLVSRSYPMYLIMAVFTGTGFAFSSGALEALVYESLPAENRDAIMKSALGHIASVGQFAFFLSPILGSLILGGLGPERVSLAILLTASALFVGLLISLTLVEPSTTRPDRRRSTPMIFGAALAELRRSRPLRRAALLAVFTAPFGGTLVTTLAAPHLSQNGVPVFLIGAALSVGSLLAALAQRNVFRFERLLGPRLALTALIFLPGVLYLLLAVAAGPLPAWLLITTMYGTNDMKAPLLSAYQNAHIASENRATVLSMTSMAVNLYIAALAPVYAALGVRSLPLAFAALGTSILLAGLLLRPDRLHSRA